MHLIIVALLLVIVYLYMFPPEPRQNTILIPPAVVTSLEVPEPAPAVVVSPPQ